VVHEPSLDEPVPDGPRLVLEDGLTGQPAARPALVGDDRPTGGHDRVVEQLVTDDALGIELRGDGGAGISHIFT
jgi:hypothetical protein